jgi:hypothetical protein
MDKKMRLIALGALTALALAGSAIQAWATNPAYLDLMVSWNGTLSVNVDGVAFSTRSVTISGGSNQLVVPGSATVTNDGNITEMWQLSVSTVNGVVSGSWANTGSTVTQPGLDQYAYQALFVSSAAAATCADQGTTVAWGAGNARWNLYTSTVTSTPVTYKPAMYADATVQGGANGAPDATSGLGNGEMYKSNTPSPGNGIRGLCVRLAMPGSVSSQTSQVVRLTVTAANVQ